MKHHVSEWKPFSELRSIQRDISDLGYKKEYIEEHQLEQMKEAQMTNMISGVICFFEPLEVKKEGNEVFWRYNEKIIEENIPKSFETQFGVFNNHNRGEFDSWLGKDDYDGPMGEGMRKIDFLRRKDYYLEGNYCDVFDCGEYVFAVSNLIHLFTGTIKIVRIDKKLNALTMFDNSYGVDSFFEYAGRFQSETGYGLIVCGNYKVKGDGNESKSQSVIRLFSIDTDGNCTISKEWNTAISPANSMMLIGDYIYFGQNKMITRLNMITGQEEYFTNKTDEELAAMVDIRYGKGDSSITNIMMTRFKKNCC